MYRTKFIFLGSGSAWSIPRLGCECRTCEDGRRENSKSQRFRSSVYIEHGNNRILLDCGPDFYHQMVREGVADLDYILISHSHNDHVAGLNDVTPIAKKKNVKIPLVTSEEVYGEINNKYGYLMDNFEKRLLRYGEKLEINGLKISYIPVTHGSYTLGFIFEGEKKVVYISDINRPLEDKHLEKIMNADQLILDGSEIFRKTVRFHMSLDEQLEMMKKSKAKNLIFTHIGHRCPPHEELEKFVREIYPDSRIAYDGMVI